MNKRRLLAPALWLLGILACAGVALFATPVFNDLSLFFPRNDAAARLLTELREGPAARVLLLAIENGSERERAEASKALAQRLRASGLFKRVLNGEALIDKNEQRLLFSRRYLLSPAITPERFSREGLRAALEQRLVDLGSPLAPFEKRLLPADPTAEMLALIQTWRGENRPETRFGVWFSPGGERALLLAETRASGFDPDAQDRVIEVVESAFAAIRKNPALSLLMGGSGVFAALSRDTIRAETQLLSMAASALVAIILLAGYRSLRLLLLGALPLATAVLAGVAAVSMLFGGIYGITLAFGVTLLGVAIDYPIHLFSHLDRRETVAQGLERIWPTLRLGALTTCIGYLAMVTTDFPGLVQLGVFTIAGLASAAAATRWLLPALLPTVWAPARAAGARTLQWLLQPPAYMAVLPAGGAVLALAAVLIIAPPLWEEDLAAASPVPAPAIALDRKLRAALGAPEAGQLIVVEAGDAQSALERSEDLLPWLRERTALGALSGFDLAARYLPSVRTQRQRQQSLPARDKLAADLQAAQQGLPFKPGLFAPFVDAVAAARGAEPLRLEVVRDTALGLRVSSLLFENDGHWTALIPLSGVTDPGALAAALDAHAGDYVRYLDLRAETNRLVADFRDTALQRLAWGGALIVLALALGLRSWRRVVAVLLPILLAIGLDVAALLALGERLSLFHLISLLLVLGIGLDYGLFFNRSGDCMQTRLRTLHGVVVCAASTLAVFGLLGLSELPVLKAIGQTVAIGVCASFILALTLAQRMRPSPG